MQHLRGGHLDAGPIGPYGKCHAAIQAAQSAFTYSLVSDVVEKTSTCRRSRIPCVVVEKITTRRREGV